jgi:hypothetical protein
MTTLEERVARVIYESMGFRYEDRTVSPKGPYGKWKMSIDAIKALLEKDPHE